MKAAVLWLNEDRTSEPEFEETEHYELTKSFLDDHARMIALLLGEMG